MSKCENAEMRVRPLAEGNGGNVPMYRCTNVQMRKYENVQMRKYENVEMRK
jgi:hypothetical protein